MSKGWWTVIVTLKLFGSYRSKLPADSQGGEVELEIPRKTSIRGLLADIDIPTDETSVILLNGLTKDLDTQLSEGDTVSAFPAMAGG